MERSILLLVIFLIYLPVGVDSVQVKYSLRHRERFAVDDSDDPDVIDVPEGFIGVARRVKRDYEPFPVIHEEHWDIQDDEDNDINYGAQDEEKKEEERDKRATTFKKSEKAKKASEDPREDPMKKYFLLILVLVLIGYTLCLLYCTYCCCCRDLSNGFGCPCRECWASQIRDTFDTYAPGMEFNAATGKFSYHAITQEEEEALGDIEEAGMKAATTVCPDACNNIC